jgi:hypothetical protein
MCLITSFPSTLGQAGCGNGPRKVTARPALCVRNDSDRFRARVYFLIYRSFPRRVFLELRQFGIYRVPRLRIGRPNFVLRFVQTRIIQSPSCDALAEIALAPKQSRTAFRAKTAQIVAARFAGCAEVFRRSPGKLERVRRDVKNSSVRSSACFLAVAAVTIEHHNWFGCNFVTNRAAGAATGNRFHFVTLKLMKVFLEQ